MGMSWRDRYAAAARVVETTIEHGSAARAARRAARLTVDREYLGGRACHCPKGLPIHLLHSQGVREGCDIVVDFGANMENPERMQLPVERVAAVAPQVRRGDSVHVKSDLLGGFVEHVLPGIRESIVLVTGDADVSPVAKFRFLLDHPRVGHWFAQNCDVAEVHPRLTRLPIGFDNPVYTRLDKRLGFLITMAAGRTPFDPRVRLNDMGNQAVLQDVRAGFSTPLGDKPLEVLCCFLHSKHGSDPCDVPDRREAERVLRPLPFARFPASRVKQLDYWRSHERFAFEASPRGSGLDCFRTWEALFLDTIPIVKTSPLDELYRTEGFPVVIVDSWAEVTEAALARWRVEMAGRFTDAMRSRLTNDHWLFRIRAAQEAVRKGAA
jgi:hypothetical protein